MYEDHGKKQSARDRELRDSAVRSYAAFRTHRLRSRLVRHSNRRGHVSPPLLTIYGSVVGEAKDHAVSKAEYGNTSTKHPARQGLSMIRGIAQDDCGEEEMNEPLSSTVFSARNLYLTFSSGGSKEGRSF